MSVRNLTAVIAAAGIGKRVGADIPKQYLALMGKTIIEHSLQPFLDHPDIHKVVVSIAKNDQWFKQLSVATHDKVQIVFGGKERVDSVLYALKSISEDDYVLVHDAARPCIHTSDINKLIQKVLASNQGGILASRATDTMKRSDASGKIIHSVKRDNLWHALTPQMFENKILIQAIEDAQCTQSITDEASAMEMAGLAVNLIEGRSDNIKVTRVEDLKLAQLYLL